MITMQLNSYLGIYNFLVLAVILFCIGLFGMLRRKNILMLFFSSEIMLNALNIGFVAASVMLDNLDGPRAGGRDVGKLLLIAHARPVDRSGEFGALGHLHHAVALAALSLQVRKRRHHDGRCKGLSIQLQRGVGHHGIQVAHLHQDLVKIRTRDRVGVHSFFSLIHFILFLSVSDGLDHIIIPHAAGDVSAQFYNRTALAMAGEI